MNFVEALNLFGLTAKEIPCITGSGAPTSNTQGAVGSLYLDTATGTIYACIGASGSSYTWIAGSGGEDGVGVQSVTQTTTSTEDGGVNVITVTLTNGQKSTFQVRNGSGNAVTFTEQTLTEEQKAQARANIGIVDENTQTATVTDSLVLTDCANGSISVQSWTMPSGSDTMTVLTRGRNALNPQCFRDTTIYTSGGVEIAIDRNTTTIVLNGTCTAERTVTAIYQSADAAELPTLTLPAGTYHFSGCPSGGNASTTYSVQWWNMTDNVRFGIDYGSGVTYTFDKAVAIKANLIIKKGYVANNTTFQFLIVDGNEAIAFEEYHGSSVTISSTDTAPILGLSSFKDYTMAQCVDGGSVTFTYPLYTEIEAKIDKVAETLAETVKTKHQDDAEFTVSVLNNSNQFSQNDITFVGDELWVSKESSTYYQNGTMIFRYKIVDGEFTLVGTCDCDFGHLNTMDYCSANDCLIFGNGGNGTETTGNYFVVVKNPLTLGSTALIANVGIKYNVDIGYKVQALWGGSNLGDNNIVYLLSNNAEKITKVLLLKDANGAFNGSLVTLESHDLETWGVQGADIFGDTLYIGGQLNGNEYAAVKEISLSDFTKTRIVKRKFYSADGTAITGCVQGIYVDKDSVWICINSGDTTKPVCLTKYVR